MPEWKKPEVTKDFEFSNVVLKVELLSCKAPVPSAGMDQFAGQMSPRKFEVSLLQKDVLDELFLAVAAGQL